MILLGLVLMCLHSSMAGPIEPMTTQQKEYYMTRGWGEASLPFSVVYSNYGRTKLQQKPTATVASNTKKPPTRKVQSKPVKKDYGMSQLFMSRGWGPSGK